jgi:hypothetical protein
VLSVVKKVGCPPLVCKGGSWVFFSSLLFSSLLFSALLCSALLCSAPSASLR